VKRSILAVLRAARAHLDRSSRWLSTRQFFRHGYGINHPPASAIDREWLPCEPRSPAARRWTIAGAIALVCPGSFSANNKLLAACVNAVLRALEARSEDLIGGDPATHADMLAVFDLAIERQRARGRRRERREHRKAA